MTLRDRNLVRCLLLCAAFITANPASAQGLFGPIQAGDTAAFHAALQSGTDTNATDEYGQTPLMYAVTFNQPDMVEALIAAGANVNAKTLAGWTALHYAARDATDNRIIEALLGAGADADARNHDGQTAHAIATSVGKDAAAGALEAAATLAPTVTGTEPGALPPSESRQWVTLVGNGFARNAVVTFSSGETDFPIPVERTEYVDSRAIRVFAGLFPADSSWTVTVTNPNGAVSNRQSIRFEAPPAVQDSSTVTPNARVAQLFRLVMAQSATCEVAITGVLGWSRQMYGLLMNEGSTRRWCGVINDNNVAANKALIYLGASTNGARETTSWRQPDPGVHGLTFLDDSGRWAVMYAEARSRSVVMVFLYASQ